MPAKRFNEADIDFDAIDGELAKLVPPKLSLTDVLDRLRKRLVEQQAKGVTVAQMHEVLNARRYRYHGAQSADVSGLRACCREGRLPRLPGPWCRKKAAIRSKPNDGAYGFAKQGSGVRRTAVRRGGFRDANNEVATGDEPGASVALQRPRTAMARSAEPMRRRCIVRRTSEPPASVSSHGWRWREAPRHGPFLCQPA